MYKTVLGMSYYIHSGGLRALVDGLRPVFKKLTEYAVNVLLQCTKMIMHYGLYQMAQSPTRLSIKRPHIAKAEYSWT